MQLSDLPMLHEWISRPHVAEWWDHPETVEDLHREYEPVIRSEGSQRALIAQLDGVPIGFIQSYVPALSHDEGWWLDEDDPHVRGIDQFIADESRIDQGLGTAMINAFVEWLSMDPTVARIQTDPDPRNARAIRCYEKAGFQPVKIVETPDGLALLMYRGLHTTP